MPREILPTPRGVARRCVNSIVRDLIDRSGLQQVWEAIDAKTRKEIEREWQDIIVVELGGSPSDL